MTIDVPDALFPLGRILSTPRVVEALAGHGLVADHTLVPYLARHVGGDWGDLDNEDQVTNDWAVAFGDERILSQYRLNDETVIWVITEPDRSATTILLPEEY